MDLNNRHSASRPTRGNKSWWHRWHFSYGDTKPLNQAGWTDEDWALYTKKTGEPCQVKEIGKQSNQS